jgi:hypothetical protein
MVNRQRIVDGQVQSGGGRPVKRSKPAPDKVAGAELSPERSQELHRELRSIDESQHAALAAGDQYYLGTRP